MTAPTYVSSGGAAKSSLGAGVTPALPAGYATNDILLLTLSGDESASVVTPTGWTILGDGTPAIANTATTGNKLYLFWRRATNSGDSPGSIDAGDHTVARIHAFTGCPTSVDPTAFVEFQSTTSSTTTPCPDYTTTSPDTLIIYIAGHGVDTTSPNYVTGSSTFDSDFASTPAKIADDSTNDGVGGGCAVWWGTVAAPNTVVTGASLAMTVTSARTAYTVALFPATVTPSSTDTASGIEGTASIATTFTDTGSGTEAGTIAASLTGTDTGSESDTHRIGITGTDSRTATEATSIAASLSSSDTTAGTEGTASIASTRSDTGSATESQSVAITVSSSDTGSVTESWSIAVTTSGSDTASGANNQSIAATLSATDTDTGTDAWSIAATLTGTDTGTETDSQSVDTSGGGSFPVSGTDTLSGTEAGQVSATLPGADTASASEAVSLSATRPGSDTVSGTEVGVVRVSSSDTLSGVDAVASRNATLSQADITAWDDDWGADETHINATLPTYSDSVAGTDVGTVDASQGTPTHVVVTTLSDSSLLVTWTASGSADYYQIERDGVIVGQSATKSFTDTGLRAHTTYSYRVRSVDVII